MGTGGTKPSYIAQHVTLYNTTGVIEKDKGIYFCPFISTNNTSLVSDVWLSAFQTAVNHNPSSGYSTIAISNWSPKDRSLVVKGNVDDFRLVSEVGKCLNYLILRRTVLTDTYPRDYYYAFFITDVQQTGNGSIRLQLESDDFTDVFYLHNKKACNTYEGDYVDVFNERMKNCYVTRQHYNRVKLTDNIVHPIEEDNREIFSLIEEGFKYKRQFRDYKEYVNYGDFITESDKEAIEDAETWGELTITLRKKILKLCTGFFHVTLNSLAPVLPYKYSGSVNPIKKLNTKLPNTNVNNELLTLVCPIYISNDLVKKFDTDINNIFNNILIKGKDSEYGTYYNYGHIGNFATFINSFLKADCVLSEYVVNAFITKESSLINYIVYENTGNNITIRTSLPTSLGDLNLSDALSFSAFINFGNNLLDEQEQVQLISSIKNNGTYYTTRYDNSVYEFEITTDVSIEASVKTFVYLMLVERVEKIEFSLNLSSNYVDKDLKTEYFDTALTFNPYSFYSVSYLGRIEVPLNKLNYYNNEIINCELMVSISESLKYSFIPTYEIDGKSQKMYTEGIEQTFANNLTIMNSKLVDFVIANQSQMKNQFAVNDTRHEYGLITTAVRGGGYTLADTVKSAVITGGDATAIGGTAVAGAIKTGTDLIIEGIDWQRDTKLIEMNQKAKLADMGNLPSNLKQVGSDIHVDLSINEMGLYLNHYTIDELSYNSICKYLERFGYVVNIYDSLNVNTRKGWDFVQLKSFDYEAQITVEQEEKIRQIFSNGVTLLHDKSFMVSGHNYEIILD